jgi:DNA-binding response OmpR family regulator
MKILVIEDDPRVADFLLRSLSSDQREVITAATGVEGLSAVDRSSFDVVIIDLMLPDLPGTEVCRVLRSKHPWTPVLMLTAVSDLNSKLDGLKSGADDYLTKPFAIEELIARCEGLVRRSRLRNAPGASRVQVLDLVVDFDSHAVTRAGVTIDLTSREFEILRLLVLRAGAVVTREMLKQVIWAPDGKPGGNVIDVFINHLRAKLDAGHPVRLIETVRGTGYRLAAKAG